MGRADDRSLWPRGGRGVAHVRVDVWASQPADQDGSTRRRGAGRGLSARDLSGGASRQEGYRVPRCASEALPRRYATLALPAALRSALAPALTTIATLTEQIALSDTALAAVATTDPVVQRLRTAPGVGVVTALTYRAVLDDVHRFADAQGVAAYLGLVPREDSSGTRHRKGGITKAGPNGLRVLLVQASWVIWRQRTGRGALHAWVERLAARRGKRIAIVALARRLGRILYAMWRDETDYGTPKVRSTATA